VMNHEFTERGPFQGLAKLRHPEAEANCIVKLMMYMNYQSLSYRRGGEHK